MKTDEQHKEQRRNLRTTLTAAEAKLWQHLKCKQLDGYRWRRQHPIGPYILDFYCPKAKLCIELDGKQHFTIDGVNADEIRTKYLKEYGIIVLRFENNEVWKFPDAVIAEILRELKLLSGEDKRV